MLGNLSNFPFINVAMYSVSMICYPGAILNQTVDKYLYPYKWVDTYKSSWYRLEKDKEYKKISNYKGGSGIRQYTIWDWEKDASDSKSGPNFF